MKKYFNIEVIESLVLLLLLAVGIMYISYSNIDGNFISIEDMKIQTMLFSHFHHFI